MTDLNDGTISSKKYNMNEDDILMDVVLIDASSSYDLVPNIDKGEKIDD